MRAGHGTLLNFTLKFGRQNLRDYLEEIVKPAFLDSSPRKYGRTRFLIHQPELIDFGSDGLPDPAIIGKFVKDTILSNEQKLVGNKLVEANDSMQSSPSATFALFLSDHRLIYFSDVPNAPSYETFETSALYFLKSSRKRYIDSEYKRLKELGKREISKKKLHEAIPEPKLNILPIPAMDDAKDIIEDFELLKLLTFKTVEPNDEFQGGEIFENLTESSRDLNSIGTLTFRNSEGLDKPSAAEHLAEATSKGITYFKATGTGTEGEKIDRTNRDLKTEVPLNPLPATKRNAIKRLRNIFADMGLR